jgi:hypothetical protein
VHGAPKRSRGQARDKAAGVRADRGHATRHASPAETRLERTLLLSLIVPGVFQIAGGERKYGILLLACYIAFWALAILYSVEIGVLAVLIWAIAILDSYNSFRKKSWNAGDPVK